MVQATSTAGEQVLVALWAVVRRMKAQAARDVGDAAALHVIHMVDEHGPLRLTGLAGMCVLDASTVSRHVRSLELAGHLARTGDPDDRRATRIAITDQGRALLRESVAARGRLMDGALAAWPPEDRAALATLLSRLAQDLA